MGGLERVWLAVWEGMDVRASVSTNFSERTNFSRGTVNSERHCRVSASLASHLLDREEDGCFLARNGNAEKLCSLKA